MDLLPDHWLARLPDNLLLHMAWPVRLESHHDDSVPARKWRGYDALGLLCWYRHRCSQWDAAFDADDEPSAQLLREEDFEAWRGPAADDVAHMLANALGSAEAVPGRPAVRRPPGPQAGR